MLARALLDQREALSALAPDLRAALQRLDDSGNLLLPQGLMLAAVALEHRADVILDLGTGGGNSATAFALARGANGAIIYTFDIAPAWDGGLKQKLGDMLDRVDPYVRPVVGDIASFDFTALVSEAQRVLVFWDAHGYAIAERVLSHLMPLIADKPHLVVCHDMSDNRLGGAKSYAERPFWRGVEGAHDIPGPAYANIGWVTSRVEQVIPILDFCWRNDIELQSFDYELRLRAPRGECEEWFAALGASPNATLDMTYFQLGDSPRHFPAAAKPAPSDL